LTWRSRLGIQPPALFARKLPPSVQHCINAFNGTILHQGNQQNAKFAPNEGANAIESGAETRRPFLSLSLAHLRCELSYGGDSDVIPLFDRNGSYFCAPWTPLSLENGDETTAAIIDVDDELKGITFLVD